MGGRRDVRERRGGRGAEEGIRGDTSPCAFSHSGTFCLQRTGVDAVLFIVETGLWVRAFPLFSQKSHGKSCQGICVLRPSHSTCHRGMAAAAACPEGWEPRGQAPTGSLTPRSLEPPWHPLSSPPTC